MRSIFKFSRKDLFGMKRFFPNNTLGKHRVSNVFRSQTWSLLYINFKPSCKYLEWVVKKRPIGN